MRHNWVFDVLKDILSYAQSNNLPALAAKVQAALSVAEAEIEAGREPSAATADPSVKTWPGRPH